jgi:hypothetical protein
VGLFPDREPRAFQGSIMTALSTVADHSPIDGKHYGAKLEIPVMYPLVAMLSLPYREPPAEDLAIIESCLGPDAPSAFVYGKLSALKFRHYVPIIALDRDRDSKGRVTIDRQGRPVVDYQLSNHDGQALAEGLVHAMNILTVSGAQELLTTVESVPPFRRHSSTEHHRRRQSCDVSDPEYQKFLHSIRSNPPQAPSNTTLLSAHQMGSCRLAISPDQGPCNPQGRLWEADNVWVCDGSLLPTASGVNPMITIYATATIICDYMEQYIKSTTKA